MFEKNIPDKELEKLSRAITEAILNSKNVKKVLEKIREKELVLPNTLMVMILKLDMLSNASDNLTDKINSLKSSSKNRDKKKVDKQLIDGKELTSDEVAFCEYMVKKFNEKDWLKKNGLVF